MPARRVRSSSAMAGSSFASVSRTTQARWPSSSRAARSVWSRSSATVASRSTARSERYAHDERLLDVGLGVAHQAGEERQGVARDADVASSLPVDVGHRGDGRADEAALPARRAVDEELELGPAVRLRGDALSVRVRQRIDRDPVAGLARRTAQELPASAPCRPGACARGGRKRTSVPRAPTRGRADRRRRGAWSGGHRGSRCGTRGRRPPGAASGRRGRVRCPARRAAVRRGTRDRRACEVRRSARWANASGSLMCSASEAPRTSAGWRCAATKATARSVVSLRVGASITMPPHRSARYA